MMDRAQLVRAIRHQCASRCALLSPLDFALVILVTFSRCDVVRQRFNAIYSGERQRGFAARPVKGQSKHNSGALCLT